jgi:hypothetical protein
MPASEKIQATVRVRWNDRRNTTLHSTTGLVSLWVIGLPPATASSSLHDDGTSKLQGVGSEHYAASLVIPLHALPCLGGCFVADGGMKTLPIIEHLDVIEHGRFGLLTGAEAALVNVLDLG